MITGRPRTHQSSFRRSGTGRRRGLNENDPSSSIDDRLWKATAMATTTKISRSTSPIWSRKTNCTCAWAMPITTPANNALGNENIPAITAAARARVMVLGPRLGIPVMDPRLPESNSREMLDRPPATVHTNSETIFGLIPERRARSALLAEAWTV